MTQKKVFKDLPKSFRHEQRVLNSYGINNWNNLVSLSDQEIIKMAKGTLCSSKNLYRIRCIARFVCELDIDPGEAGLLMHSGLASVEALAYLTPEELFKRTGRLERILRTGREPIVNLEKASFWIKKAKNVISN